MILNERSNGTRYFQIRHNEFGIPLCLIPTCNKEAFRRKNGKYLNYCSDHNWSDMREFTNWGNIRGTVAKRDNFTCKKCNKENLSSYVIDHIKPIALGGDEWNTNNMQTLCIDCNKIKTKKDIQLIAIERKIPQSQVRL